MLKNIKNIIIIVLLVIAIFFIWDKLKPSEPQKIPVIVKVKVPEIKGSSEAIIKPKDYNVIDITNLNRYRDSLSNKEEYIKESISKIDSFRKANDSLKVKMYLGAIETREYNQMFTDTFQDVSVKSLVRGELLEQSISYKTNSFDFTHETEVTVPSGRFKVFGLLEGGSDLLMGNENNFVGKGTIIFKNSKDNGISVSASTDKKLWFGYMFKF